MSKTPCPKCGKPASANARGPDYVHCRPCGGLVAVDQDDGGGSFDDRPVNNAIARERGWFEAGVIRSPSPDRGGLGS